jgi:hypothetical protein
MAFLKDRWLIAFVGAFVLCGACLLLTRYGILQSSDINYSSGLLIVPLGTLVCGRALQLAAREYGRLIDR